MQDLRLLQLLGNCFPPGDNYYVEDEDLEKRLKMYYEGWLRTAQVKKMKKTKRKNEEIENWVKNHIS